MGREGDRSCAPTLGPLPMWGQLAALLIQLPDRRWLEAQARGCWGHSLNQAQLGNKGPSPSTIFVCSIKEGDGEGGAGCY